jgi:hypothetical protein
MNINVINAGEEKVSQACGDIDPINNLKGMKALSYTL